jgi:poly(3-hydroxyalkanoate) depolymerase
MSRALGRRARVEFRSIRAGGYDLRVATTLGKPGSLPLLVFNGLGANLELLRGFAEELGKFGIGIVAFDVPGVGGSSAPLLPYRLWHLACLADKVLARLEIVGQVDVAGVSWGGALAQEFTHRYSRRVRRLLLAATTAGAFAVPGRWSVLSKMLDSRRYADPEYMARVGANLYGGKFREEPRLAERLGKLMRAPRGAGYYFQLLAGAGWTSAFWLRGLRQQTLVMMGTDDPIVPIVNGRLLARLLPNARLTTVRDGHLFLATSARECAPVIAGFLNDGAWPGDRELAAS